MTEQEIIAKLFASVVEIRTIFMMEQDDWKDVIAEVRKAFEVYNRMPVPMIEGDWVACRTPSGAVYGGIIDKICPDGSIVVGGETFHPENVRLREWSRELMSEQEEWAKLKEISSATVQRNITNMRRAAAEGPEAKPPSPPPDSDRTSVVLNRLIDACRQAIEQSHLYANDAMIDAVGEIIRLRFENQILRADLKALGQESI